MFFRHLFCCYYTYLLIKEFLIPFINIIFIVTRFPIYLAKIPTARVIPAN